MSIIDDVNFANVVTDEYHLAKLYCNRELRGLPNASLLLLFLLPTRDLAVEED